MRAHDWRNLSTEELRSRAASLKGELYEARLAVESGKEKNSAKISDLKRDVARVQTVMRERNGLAEEAQ